MPPRRPVEVEITLAGRPVRYRVRPSTRARRLRLRALPGTGLEVVLPRGATLADAAAFVERETEWVLRALERLAALARPPLADGALLRCHGEMLRLVVRPGARATARREGERLLVVLPPGRALEPVVERWYRREARRLVEAHVARHADRLGVQPARVVIRDTRSRWGSCSSSGTLSFSWRLLLAPPEVLDYVAAHEVAHLLELNHAPRFWSLVAMLCPDYRHWRAWLRDHGDELLTWG